MMYSQVFRESGSVLNTLPPTCTISIVTAKIKTIMPINFEFFSRPSKIDLFLPITRALNIFHQLMHIYVAKKMVLSMPNHRRIRQSIQINPPKPKIALPSDLVIINSFLLRGVSSKTFSSAGSDASAMAASESITRFIQRNWVTVNGIVTPISGLNIAIRHAEILIESCR